MVLIIGAGLSGLLTGYLLKKEGIPFKIIEARNGIGGRINTVYGTNNSPIEMGATWFTNQHKHLMALLEELEIDYFEQHMWIVQYGINPQLLRPRNLFKFRVNSLVIESLVVFPN